MALGEEDKPPVRSTQRCSKWSSENKEKTGIPGPPLFSKQLKLCLDYTCTTLNRTLKTTSTAKPTELNAFLIHLKPTLCSLIRPVSLGEENRWFFHLFPSTHAKDLHSPKFNMQPKDDDFQKDLLFQGTIARFHGYGITLQPLTPPSLEKFLRVSSWPCRHFQSGIGHTMPKLTTTCVNSQNEFPYHPWEWHIYLHEWLGSMDKYEKMYIYPAVVVDF